MRRNGSHGRLLLAVVLTALVLVGGSVAALSLTQHLAYREERAWLDKKSYWLARELAALEVTESKRDEFEREVASTAEKVRLVRLILPAELDVPSFLARYRTMAESEGVTIAGEAVEVQDADPGQRAIVRLELRGSPEGIESLRQRTLRMARLAHWRRLEPGAPGPTIQLTIFARPAAPAPSTPACGPGRTDVWLWPWTSALEERRRAVEEACVRIASHAETKRQIDALGAQRDEVKELIRVIEPLKAAQSSN